jgi:uncharacterized protein with PIN domain
MAVIDKCPIKDEHYREVLKKLNGDTANLYRVWLAYGEVLPSIEQLRKDGVISDTEGKPRFQAVIDNYIDRRSGLYKNLASIRDEAKKAKGDKKLELNKQIQSYERQITELTSKIEELDKLSEFEPLYTYAKADLAMAEKILRTENVSMVDMQRALRIIKLWKRVGSIDERNPFFNAGELKAFEDSENITAQEIHQNLKNIQSKAEILNSKWYRIAEDIVRDKIGDTLNTTREVDLKNVIRDIGKLSAMTLDISEYDNVIAKAMFMWNKQATHESNQEVQKIFNGIEDVMKVLGKRFTDKEFEEIFAQTQSNTDSRRTGDIVFRWSQEWFNWDKLRREKLNFALENAEGETKKNLILKSIKEYKDNSIMLDARKLFPIDDRFNAKDAEEHKQELIKHLGQKGFEFYYERVKSKVEEYKLLREAEEEDLRDTYGNDEATIMRELERFEALYSPYKAADNFYDGKISKVAGEYLNYRRSYIEVIPKRFVNGKDTGFYDKKFERIENDKDLKAVYDYLIKTIHTVNSYLPEDIKRNIQSNTLPFIKKGVVEQFMQKGLSKGFVALRDGWTESIRTGMGGTRELSSQRDIEGERIRQVQFTAGTDVTKVINDYIDRKTIEFWQQYGESRQTKDLLIEKKLEWKKEIQEQLSEDRSFNLEAILKIYSMAAVSYKHKAKIEDAMNIAYSILNNAVEQQTTNAGEDIRDQYGKPISKQGLANFSDGMDYFMATFYGEPKTLTEGAFGEKIYTSKEKLTKEELEQLAEQNKADLSSGSITKQQYLARQKIIDTQLAKLGGKKTLSDIGDNVNMYIRLKGLGWNLFAPIMNMQVGYFTNMTEASGGKRFTQAQMTKAYGQVFWDKTGKVAKLMEKLDVLKEVQNEAYQSKSVAKGWRKRLAPFYLTNRAEYINQAPVMVATLMNTKVKVNGKEMSLWEAYDKDGNLPENVEFVQDKLGEAGVKTRIDQTIKDIHGNYDPDAPILANKYIIGRSLLVFRKWMINSYYNRLRQEKFDEIEGFTKKGRWRSYGNYFSEYGAFGGIFQMTLQLGKKIMFMNTNFDEKLSDIDAQNMRKNLTEILFLMSATSLALLLKALTKGDDDDDEGNLKYLCYFYINQLGRLERDIMFYIDPQQFKSVLKDPFPIMGVVGDSYDVVTRSFNLITGGEDDYQSGFRKGQSKTWTSVKKMVPGASNIDRLQSMTESVLNK